MLVYFSALIFLAVAAVSYLGLASVLLVPFLFAGAIELAWRYMNVRNGYMPMIPSSDGLSDAAAADRDAVASDNVTTLALVVLNLASLFYWWSLLPTLGVLVFPAITISCSVLAFSSRGNQYLLVDEATFSSRTKFEQDNIRKGTRLLMLGCAYVVAGAYPAVQLGGWLLGLF